MDRRSFLMALAGGVAAAGLGGVAAVEAAQPTPAPSPRPEAEPAKVDEAIGLPKPRQRPEQQRAGNREDGGVRADADGKRERGRQREEGTLTKEPNGEPKVIEHRASLYYESLRNTSEVRAMFGRGVPASAGPGSSESPAPSAEPPI